MSEPINVDPKVRQREGGNVAALRIELPPNPVGAKMVPHHMAGENGSLVRTGKIEVRIENPITKRDAKRTVDWHATAMNCAHQTAYYKQVYDNMVMRTEELERKYSNAATNAETYRRDFARLQPVVAAALDLGAWWGFRFLPKTFRRAITNYL